MAHPTGGPVSAPLTSPGGVVRPFGWSHFRSFGASSWIFACLLLCTLFLGIFALGLRPKSSFWPLWGHIFSSVFSPGLVFRPASVVLRSALFCGAVAFVYLRGFLCSVFFRLSFAAPCFLISFVFLVGFLFFISFVSLSVLFSALFHSFSLGTSVLWLFPYIFLFYFYIFLFVRLSICERVG